MLVELLTVGNERAEVLVGLLALAVEVSDLLEEDFPLGSEVLDLFAYLQRPVFVIVHAEASAVVGLALIASELLFVAVEDGFAQPT